MDLNRKHKVSLRGASSGEISRDALLAKVSQERELRSYTRRANAASLYIQRVWRSYIVRKKAAIEIQEEWENLLSCQSDTLTKSWVSSRVLRPFLFFIRSLFCTLANAYAQQAYVEYSKEVLQSPLVVCPFTPSNMAKISRSTLSSFKKREDDPFLEAYRKCLERSPLRVSSLGRNVRADQDCYAKSKKKSFLLWLWNKYSFGTYGWSTVSRFRKPKSNKRFNST